MGWAARSSGTARMRKLSLPATCRQDVSQKRKNGDASAVDNLARISHAP